MEDNIKRPKVGIGVLIRHNNKVLFGKSKHGEGTWCPPGGHLEFGESIEDCAKREAFEETGVQIKNIQIAAITNDIHETEDKHYLTVHLVADYDSGEVKITEPDKFETWEWFEWENLPQPLFLAQQNLKKQSFNPFKIN